MYPLTCGPKMLPDYLLRVLLTPKFTAYATKASTRAQIPKLNRKALFSFQFPLPPLAEQRRIVDILNRANGIRRLRREALAKTRQLIPALFVDTFGDPVSNPRGWPIVRLGGLLDFTTSGSRGWGKYYSDAGASFIRVQNLTRNELSLRDVAHVDPPAGAEAERTKISAGDVLLAITGAPGLAAVAPDLVDDAYVNQHVAILRPKSDILGSTYLWGFIASTSGGQLQLGLSAYGQTRAGLGFAQIRALQCPLPPLGLQHEFASRVAGIQATIAQQERMAEASEQLVAALMAQLFDGGAASKAAAAAVAAAPV